MKWLLSGRVDGRVLGRAGERRAAWHYRLRGYSIVACNIRLRSGEIDLAARRGGILAIVEVKTRQSLTAGEGHDSVDERKRMKLIRLGDELLASRRDLAGLQLRYDIVSIYWTGWRFKVDRYEDAFRPMADPQRPWKWRA